MTAGLRVAPIVEGHGEQRAIRILLQRIGFEICGNTYIEVLEPIRQPRDRLIQNKNDTLSRAVQLASNKLQAAFPVERPGLILILLDADKDCAAEFALQVLNEARSSRADQDISCVFAVVEYETWFVAAADSLRDVLDLSADDQLPEQPEVDRCGKGWIAKRIKAAKYSETVDQPRLTQRMDLSACRSRCPSFDKLCREIERALSASS